MILKEVLERFSLSDKRTFEEKFEEIARTILYDGYIRIRDEYRVYIKTVEFYFHSETGSPFNVKDPIVYHRNGKYPNRNVPYFPLLTLHAHASGFDITFENEALKYRASALIRAYEIFDIRIGSFIETKKGHKFDDRSTFLYDYLNGFSVGGDNDILWVDKKSEVSHILNPPAPRRNVFEYDGEQKTKRRDMRLWSYTRINDIVP